jgi:hypothetical protein
VDEVVRFQQINNFALFLYTGTGGVIAYLQLAALD